VPPNLVPPKPTLDLERALSRDGATAIAGVDEVGVGAIAGPLIAVAVILSPTDVLAAALDGVRDSNQVRKRDRAPPRRRPARRR
jgi:ribonuclease HII